MVDLLEALYQVLLAGVVTSLCAERVALTTTGGTVVGSSAARAWTLEKVSTSGVVSVAVKPC